MAFGLESRYLGITLDPFLNWHFQSNEPCIKLCRANGMLSKIRHYVSLNMCRMVYFGIFHSLLTYSCQIWGQVPRNN